MKINPDFVLKEVVNCYILVDTKSSNNYVIKINQTSKEIFDMVNNGLDKQNIIQALYDKYNIEKEVLTKDVDDFFLLMKEKKVFIDEQ